MERMSANQIMEAVRLNNPALVKEIFAIAQQQMQSESARQSVLDGKANSLLGVVGLTLTLVLSLGGQLLLPKSSPLDGLPAHYRTTLVGALALGIVLALLSGGMALLAVRVTGGYRGINEKAVFDTEALECANKKAGEDAPATEYRRFLIPHIWGIYQSDFGVHDKKAALIEKAQWCFFGFVMCVAAIGGVIVMACARG